ncbi:MAG: hypothetical protein AMXMBFR84_25030 [Candidatus Hydrogenedentota bacterium]
MVRGADSVAKHLLERCTLDIVAFHDATGRVLRDASIPHRSFDELATHDMKSAVLNDALGRIQALSLWAGQASFEHSNAIVESFARHAAEAMMVIALAREWAAWHDVRLALVAEDLTRDNKALVQALRRAGVPTLHMLHGVPNGAHGAHAALHSDHLAVFSDSARALYRTFGVPSDRITVTGNPMWDLYHRPPRPQVKRRFCSALNLDPNRPIITYAMTAVPPLSARCISAEDAPDRLACFVLDAFRALHDSYPEWQFLLRPHPSQMDRVAAILAGSGCEFVRSENEPPYDAVASADVVLCTESHFGVEAILLGKPVINVVPPDCIGGIYDEGAGGLFHPGDAVAYVTDAAAIRESVVSAIIDEGFRTRMRNARLPTAKRINGFTDGHATERLCDLALDIMANEHRYTRPLDRYPSIEKALTQMVAAAARKVAVLGNARESLAKLVRIERPHAQVDSVYAFEADHAGFFDAVLISDPIAFEHNSEELLCGVRGLLAPNGLVHVAFRAGLGATHSRLMKQNRILPPRRGYDSISAGHGFTWTGVEDLMARSGYCVKHAANLRQAHGQDDIDGWIVTAGIVEPIVAPVPQ